ncbi:MAG: hypothetical protein QXH80_00455 [Candidatus Nanoarchaeia archaeon]
MTNYGNILIFVIGFLMFKMDCRGNAVLSFFKKIANFAGYTGKIEWDSSMPDGMPRKCLDISKLTALGFKAKISLDDGIKQMIEMYCSEI